MKMVICRSVILQQQRHASNILGVRMLGDEGLNQDLRCDYIGNL